jgi:hypothetical protein
MKRTHQMTSAVAAALSLAACAHITTHVNANRYVLPEQRLDAIRRAQVWAPTDVAAMDLRAGPRGTGAFAPDQVVTCDYKAKQMNGATPKFTCVLPPDDELKVKYGRQNGEVYAEVASSRLFWALGFIADRMYPVRVICRGCPAYIKGTEMASVQRKAAGHEIEVTENSGWAWPELDLVQERLGGASRAQRDALKLLAVLVQHTDSKPEQQRLLCRDAAPRTALAEAPCEQPVMMVHDLGKTFGRANLFNRDAIGTVNLQMWSTTRVWTTDTGPCVGNLPRSQTGTLANPLITEAGRRFLADLLQKLSDAQMRDLFEVSRFHRYATASESAPDSTSIDQWVDAFKNKRAEIVNRTCQA